MVPTEAQDTGKKLPKGDLSPANALHTMSDCVVSSTRGQIESLTTQEISAAGRKQENFGEKATPLFLQPTFLHKYLKMKTGETILGI